MDKYTIVKRPVTDSKTKVGEIVELSPAQAKFLLLNGMIERVGGLTAPGKIAVEVYSLTVPEEVLQELEEELEGEEDGNISSAEHN